MPCWIGCDTSQVERELFHQVFSFAIGREDLKELPLEMIVVRLGHVNLDAANQDKLAVSKSVIHDT